ncbi:VWA domain-containing protein [Brevibacillus sp. B_LB10_24]|uniref:VWA domain-containing protein n=1 Tax=Brevibacillus sp. B_LB10_24 TaxID=3380645 RepID=UPI0038BAE03A
MGISFLRPMYLLLLFLALFAVIWWWRGQKNMQKQRRLFIASIRTLVFACLILALAGTQLLYSVKAETVVFVVDRSASMKDDSRLVPFLREAVAHKQEVDPYGIVAVGQTAGVEQPLTTRSELTSLGVEVGAHATNLAEGIRLAAGMIPSGARGKIVLLSDGLATHGDAEAELALAKSRGIAFEAVSLQQPPGDEVVLSSVRIPDQLYLGEEFQIKVDVESTVATRALLRLYAGNQQIGVQQVAIEKGQNHFLFSQRAGSEGFQRYRAEILPESDTVLANNQAYAFTQVAGAARVLLIEGHPGAAKNLASALEAGGMRVDVKEPALLPQELDGYKAYASIVLADVAATQVKEPDMVRLRTAVSDLGIGLVMTGGADSFGLGGWFKTPIEEALPVYMDLRGKEKLPSLGLVLVIDKSGSMDAGMGGYNKMELAKEAAIRSTEMLNEKDQIGVVAFDGEPWVVLEPQAVTDLPKIQEQIGRIYADGGTDIFPALETAYEQVKALPTQRKHVILLTDGQSGRDDDYEGLLGQMAKEGITVSTVAVGDDADTYLLEDIATMGKGRFYFANDPSAIPQIFSKETALASKTFIVEKPQIPALAGGRDWPVLRSGVPPIHAYVATTVKQTAEQVLVSADSDPILARWQYGLGRTVAWTSDLEGKWAPDWITWAGSSPLWSDIVGWTFPQIASGEWRTETKQDGSRGIVTVTLPEGAEMPQEMEAVVVNHKLEREKVPLKPIAPGKLQGEFAAADPGTYLLQVMKLQGGKIASSQTAGLAIPYSPEYGLRQDGEERLQELVRAADGALIDDPASVFSGKLPKKWERQPISELLLVLAAILWPLDVAARRLQLPEQWWQRAVRIVRLDKARGTVPAPVSASSPPPAGSSKSPSAAPRDTGIDPNRPQAQKAERAAGQKTRQTTPAERNTEAFNRLLEAKKRKQK